MSNSIETKTVDGSHNLLAFCNLFNVSYLPKQGISKVKPGMKLDIFILHHLNNYLGKFLHCHLQF